MSAPFVRFAPSPTGRLHVGNGRIAVVNWLFARQQGGRFLLRLDDTDAERSTAAFAAGIETDLAWLGLAWDSFARQSDRLAHYTSAAERLKASGRLYPCYETPEELGLKRKAQLAAGRPPRYDRAALRLSADERRASSGSTAQRGCQRRHCTIKSSTRCIALNPTTSKRSGWRPTTSSVLVPIDPVEPRMTSRCRIIRSSFTGSAVPAPAETPAAARRHGRARRRGQAAGGWSPWRQQHA